MCAHFTRLTVTFSPHANSADMGHTHAVSGAANDDGRRALDGTPPQRGGATGHGWTGGTSTSSLQVSPRWLDSAITDLSRLRLPSCLHRVRPQSLNELFWRKRDRFANDTCEYGHWRRVQRGRCSKNDDEMTAMCSMLWCVGRSSAHIGPVRYPRAPAS